MHHSLPRLWPRLTLPPLVDLALAGAFVALTLVEGLVAEASARSPVGLVVAGLSLAALAWRRQFPLVVAALVLAAILVTDPENEFSVLLALVLVAFTVGSETDPPRSHVGLAIVVVPFVAVLASEGLQPSDLAAALVFLVGPWAVGTLLRQGTPHPEAWAVPRPQSTELQAARRPPPSTRIARELHDIVSHSISVVTIQAQAVRRRLRPEHAREADDLAGVEVTAREALAEMRRLFGVLRGSGDGAALAPQPGLADAARLVELACGPPPGHAPCRGGGVPVAAGPGPRGVPDPPGRPDQRAAARGRHPGGPARAIRTGRSTSRRGRRAGRPRPGRRRRAWLGRCAGRVALYEGRVSAGPGPGGGSGSGPGCPWGTGPSESGSRGTTVTSVVIVDDQGMVRAGFRSLLEGEPDLIVVGEAGNGEEAVEVVRRLFPDVTLMDIRMPVLDGIAATRRLVAEGVATRVLVLTTFDLDEYVFEALRAGASGFLLKDAPADELAAAIRVVASGDSLLDPA